MWIKIKKWLTGNTASGIYAYTITKIGDAMLTPKNLVPLPFKKSKHMCTHIGILQFLPELDLTFEKKE